MTYLESVVGIKYRISLAFISINPSKSENEVREIKVEKVQVDSLTELIFILYIRNDKKVEVNFRTGIKVQRESIAKLKFLDNICIFAKTGED